MTNSEVARDSTWTVPEWATRTGTYMEPRVSSTSAERSL
jgi:hypothetical protein